MGALSYARNLQLLRDSQAVGHSYEMISQLKTLARDLAAPSESQEQILARDLDSLLQLSESNQSQHDRVVRLRALFKVRRELAESKQAEKIQSHDKAVESYVETLLSEERGLLQQRQENLNFVAENNSFGLALGTVGCALLMIGVAGVVLRDLARSVRVLQEGSQRVGQGDYSFRLQVSGDDELSRVGLAFNAMAEQIHSDRQHLLDAEADLKASNQDLHLRAAELQRHHHETLYLQQLMELLQSAVSLTEAVKLLGPFLGRLLEGSGGGIFFMNSSKNLLELACSWGSQSQQEPAISPEECWALRRGKPHYDSPAEPELRCPHWLDQDVHWHCCSPLLAHGETLGILTLAYLESLSESRQRLLRSTCEQVALALANLRLRDSLRQQSIRDPLTGLFNRRFLEESLLRECSRAQRRGESMSVVMLDVDHFKKFNDDYGHEAGDLVLQSVAQYLKTAVRGEDVVCRYGGEEFCIICPTLGRADLEIRLEKMRVGLQEMGVLVGSERLQVTASFGAALYPEHGDLPAPLLQLADAAMYSAKRSGRNCFRIAPSPASA